jgi:GNAT superfamily N-acetyltransferase
MTDAIDVLVPPAELDGSPEARAFVEAVAILDATRLATHDSEQARLEPGELLPSWQGGASATKRMLVARTEGRVAGVGIMEWRTEHDVAGESWQSLAVHPDSQGRGIGRSLADHMERLARAEGKSRIIVRADTANGPGERLAPRSGGGSLPSDNRDVRFLRNRGYVLEQVSRLLRLPLPADPAVLDDRLAYAREKSGEDYRLVYWGDRVPEEWRHDVVLLWNRLGHDVPLAGVPLAGLGDATRLTVERLVEREEAATGPARQLNIAVEHVPSGRLAGFTTLVVPADPAHAVGQGTTIVMAEHRGHRLSLWLKVANIQNLERAFPGYPSILTSNAEENRYMLDVNLALGFETTAGNGTWTATLRQDG